MRIGMILFDPQPIGGLEEYATTYAIALRALGEDVCIVSMTWTPPDNQYVRRWFEAGIPLFQPPRWLSLLASDWAAKDRILAIVMTLLSPVVLLLAAGLMVWRRSAWPTARASAFGWLRGKLQGPLVATDRRPALSRRLLGRWRRCWRPDVIHIHGYANTLLFAVDWACQRGSAIVYEEHQTPDERYDWWRNTPGSINKADVVIAVSKKSADALREVCGARRPLVVIEPVAPDPALMGWEAPPVRLHTDGGLEVTTIARLIDNKGLAYLLEAIPQVRALFPATQFRVYGEGPQREALIAQAERLGLEGAALFPGPFTERHALARIMHGTDVFALPSLLEGQPVALIEAMAYGRPIAATNVGGIPELIQDGMNGLLCPPGDSSALATCITDLIGNPALRARLGAAARQSYLHGPFEARAAAQRLRSVYQQALRPESVHLH